MCHQSATRITRLWEPVSDVFLVTLKHTHSSSLVPYHSYATREYINNVYIMTFNVNLDTYLHLNTFRHIDTT